MTDLHPMPETLASAASGALEAQEERRLRTHLAGCPVCARELEELQVLGLELRRLPAVPPGADLVERVRRLAHLDLAGRADEKLNQLVMVFLLVFSWTVTLVGFAAIRLLAGEGMELLGLLTGPSVSWAAGYFVTAWLAGAAVFIALGLHTRRRRRLV